MSAKALEGLVDELNKLPGIGKKSATRLAFYIMESTEIEIERLVRAIKEVKLKVRKCSVCGNISEEEICDICSDEERERSVICVVEDTKDIIALEKAKFYNGRYHVLNGKIAPLMGVGVDQLNIEALVRRVAQDEVKEVIVALDPDLEGETTALYLKRILSPFGIKISKLASGIPVGGNIEFSDSATLYKSLNGRVELK